MLTQLTELARQVWQHRHVVSHALTSIGYTVGTSSLAVML